MDGATYLRRRRGVLGLLVVPDAQEAREPQRDAFFWVHLRGTKSHDDDEVTAKAAGCQVLNSIFSSFLIRLKSFKTPGTN